MTGPAALKRWTLAGLGAVPWTGRGNSRPWCRRPRNMAVRRGLIAARGTLRGIKVPPDASSDLDIAADQDRCWKRHRATKWRTPP